MRAELLWARRFCNSHGWPTIDVTRRSIEETAATVLQLMEAWHNRQAKAAEGGPAAQSGIVMRLSALPRGRAEAIRRPSVGV